MMFADADFWLKATKEVGFPIVAAIASAGAIACVGLAIWTVIKWTGNVIIIPIRDGLLTFGHSVQSNLDSQTVAMREIVTNMRADNAEIKKSLLTLVHQGCATHRNGDGNGSTRPGDQFNRPAISDHGK